MKDEYIIINKTAIQKRIEELEKDSIHVEWQRNIKTHNGHSPQQRKRKEMVDLELNTLKEILSDLTPLIPEIEKAFDAGFHKGYNVGQADAQSHPLSLTIANHIHNDRQDYISNLKLDI